MTTLIILTVVVLSSAVVTVLVLYAIGKIRSIEEITSQLMTQGTQSNTGDKRRSGPFSGLQGKALWDMLTEKNVPSDVRQSDLQPFREQYAPVLTKTIKSIFTEGANDCKFGQPRGTPKNDRSIKTLRLTITSWLPFQELSSLYNTGYDSVHAEQDERARLRKTLEEVIGSLFGMIKAPAPAGLADSLFADDAAQLAAEDNHSNAGLVEREIADNNDAEDGSTSNRD